MLQGNFFNAKSVAVIGASAKPKKVGHQIVANIKNNGYRGKVYPINPKAEEVEGYKTYKDISAIKAKIDLAVIVIPAQEVITELEQCARAGVKNIVIISAGFKEVGGEGILREEKIVELAAKEKLNILGPNCFGFISSDNNLNVTFARSKSTKGNIGFISQSGAICSSVLDWVQDKKIGFSKFVNLGNKCGLDENDFFEFFIKDKETKLVIAYLEEIENGGRLLESLTRLARIKPVAILKTGQSKEGAKAALSHTGSLAGSSEAVLAGLKRSGAIILDSLEEMFDLMALSVHDFNFKNKDIFLISNAGGPLVATTDCVEKTGLKIGELPLKVISALKVKLPPIVQIKNPLDIVGDAGADRYREAIEAFLKDKNISMLLALLTPQTATDIEGTAEVISELAKKYKEKIIAASFIGGASLKKARQILTENGVAQFYFPDRAIRILDKMAAYKEIQKNIRLYNYDEEEIAVQKNEQKDFMESAALLKKYDIPFAKTVIINDLKELDSLEYPVVLKAVGKNIIHKTDEKGVYVNIKNKEESRIAVRGMGHLLSQDGNYIIAQEYIENSLEMIIGFKRDKSFGPIILAGSGGIYAQVFNDIEKAVGDLNFNEALALVKKLKISSVISGARTGRVLDIKALANVIVSLARLAKENPDLHELDINPLLVREKGVVAVDIRIIL